MNIKLAEAFRKQQPGSSLAFDLSQGFQNAVVIVPRPSLYDVLHDLDPNYIDPASCRNNPHVLGVELKMLILGCIRDDGIQDIKVRGWEASGSRLKETFIHTGEDLMKFLDMVRANQQPADTFAREKIGISLERR